MSTATPLPSSSPFAVPRGADTFHAQAWRFFRHGWQTVLLPLLLLCGLPTAMALLISMLHPNLIENLSENPASVRRLYVMFAVGVLPTLVLFEMLKVRPLYPLPLTTRRIVGTQALLGSASLTAIHLLAVVYFRVVFSATIPVIGPLLILIPLLLVCAAIVSLWIDAVWWKPVVSLTWLTGALWWIGRRLTDFPLNQDARWFTPTPREFVVLCIVAGIACVVAYRAVVRDRQGENRPWADIEDSLYRLGAAIGRWWPSFTRSRSRVASVGQAATEVQQPARALSRYEWQTRGLVLPICAIGFGSLSLIAAYYDPQEWLQSYFAALPGLLFFGMAVNGYFAGLIDGPGLTGTMDRYRATRPLSDRQLAHGLLRNGAISSGAALAISVGLAIVVCLYLVGQALIVVYQQPEFRGMDFDVLWSYFGLVIELPYPSAWQFGLALVTAVVAGWAAMGFNLSCISSGRHWIVTVLWLSAVGVMVANIMFGAWLGDEQAGQLMRVLLFILAGVSIVLTIGCFQVSIQGGLIDSQSWLIMCGLWLAGAAIFIAGAQQVGVSRPTLFAVAGLGSLVALPIASAPLAVWLNRHR